jgi:dipeptidase E
MNWQKVERWKRFYVLKAMKAYLSSYKLGNQTDKLKAIVGSNKKCAYISNALDFTEDYEKRNKHEKSDIKELESLGFDVDLLDLRDYFDKGSLEDKIQEYGLIWVSGGNTFVLRQAYRLSKFDEVLLRIRSQKSDLVYGGYSAGICILQPSLKGTELVDPPEIGPYFKDLGVIWEGLGLVPYNYVVHYQSDHLESEDANKELEYLVDNKILFKALRDGDVEIISDL